MTTSQTEAKLDQIRDEGRSALIGYLPMGFPTVEGSIEAVTAMVDAGVDIVELGLPYSDPVMDGPVIQRASETALRAGARVRDVFGVVEAVRAHAPQTPVLLMSYWNPIMRPHLPRGPQLDAGPPAAGRQGLARLRLRRVHHGGHGRS